MSKIDKIKPTHVGIILDGNRRWARANNIPTLEGHRAGAQNIKVIGDLMVERGIKFFSAYTFSTENWSRSKDEVKYLMALILKFLKKDVEYLHQKNIRMRWFGEEYNLSSKMIKALKDAEELTKNNKKGTLNLCFNYGGQQEIVDSCNKLLANGKKITKEAISKALYCSDVPSLDLVIRTSGERRISNFMLWRVAYSELYFTDVMWPDFDEKELDKALCDYNSRQRRFGG